MNTKIIALLLLLSMGLPAWAQTETDPTDEPTPEEIAPESIDIVKPYEPILADAIRLGFSPLLPKYTEEERNPTFNNYLVPSRLLTMSYEPGKLKPLAYKQKRKRIDPKHIWLQAGFGNLSTPLLDVSLSTGKSKKFVLGANGSHISSKGKLEFQDFSKTSIGGYSKFFLKRGAVLDVDLGYKRNSYGFYGFDQSDSTLVLTEDSLTQVFQNFLANIEISNSIENKANIDFDIKATFDNYRDKFDTKEDNIILNTDLVKLLGDNTRLGAIALLHFSSYNKDTTTFNDLMFNFTPTFSYLATWGMAKVGANLLADHNGFYAYPDLLLEGNLVPERLTLYGGLNKSIIKNNYKALTQVNPFVGDLYDFNNSIQAKHFLGVKGDVGYFVSYNAQVYQKVTQNQPLFVNDPSDMKRFDIVYEDKMKTIGGQVEVGLQVDKKFSTNLKLGFDNYELETQEKAWHLPTFNLTLSGDYQPIEKLQLTGDVYVINGLSARLADGEVEELKGAMDINLGAKYLLLNNISLFFNVNNLASVKYERFLNYPTYGFNAIGGVFVRF